MGTTFLPVYFTPQCLLHLYVSHLCLFTDPSTSICPQSIPSLCQFPFPAVSPRCGHISAVCSRFRRTLQGRVVWKSVFFFKGKKKNLVTQYYWKSSFSAAVLFLNGMKWHGPSSCSDSLLFSRGLPRGSAPPVVIFKREVKVTWLRDNIMFLLLPPPKSPSCSRIFHWSCGTLSSCRQHYILVWSHDEKKWILRPCCEEQLVDWWFIHSAGASPCTYELDPPSVHTCLPACPTRQRLFHIFPVWHCSARAKPGRKKKKKGKHNLLFWNLQKHCLTWLHLLNRQWVALSTLLRERHLFDPWWSLLEPGSPTKVRGDRISSK